jgi:UDP-N-acetylmuramyl pentapeptide phosphotransferase/UDP-N-acetylglucosamine-1-phosphate transferase
VLQKKQVGESIRDLGLQGQNEKKGTPTMGGLIIILAILVPVIYWPGCAISTSSSCCSVRYGWG